MPERASARRGRSRLTSRDLELLAFVTEHRAILAHQAGRFLRASSSVAYARLRALGAAGLLHRQRVFHGQPSCYLATAAGIRAVGKSYRAQKIEFGCLQHDLGLASLWLAVRAGTFGPVKEIVSERAMRSLDGSPDRSEDPLGVRLGGTGESGRERLHYPDLLLVDPNGKRIAFELELTAKGVARRDKILMGYAFDRNIDAVMYLVRERSTGRKIQDSARRIGISDLVHVQLVKGLPQPTGPSREPARSASRTHQEAAR